MLKSKYFTLLFAIFCIYEILSQSGLNCANPTLPTAIIDSSNQILWGADADKIDETNDLYQMTRYVFNKGNESRRVMWKLGRMSINSLYPGEWAQHCPPNGKGRNIVEGPIYLGSNGVSISTVVYENIREPNEIAVRNGKQLNLITRFSRGSNENSAINRGIHFEASLRYVENRFLVNIEITNIGNDEFTFILDGVPRNYIEEYKEQLSPLKPGVRVIITYYLNEFPIMSWLPATITNSDGILLERIELLGMIPVEGWN